MKEKFPTVVKMGEIKEKKKERKFPMVVKSRNWGKKFLDRGSLMTEKDC